METSNNKTDCCNIDDWMNVSSSNSKIMCKVHGTIFNISDRCPSRNGKVPSEMIVKSEQGVEQGVTITNKATFDKLSSSVLEASKVSHAFRFVVTLQNPINWSNRRMTLESKGLNVQLKGGIGRVYMAVFKGFKIWLADKSITIYFPDWKKYYVDEARFGYNFALNDLKEFLDELSKFMGCSFLIDGSYRFKVSGQHHALIYNSLAKMYNRNKEKLNVYDSKGELWLLIDNSRRESIRMDDTETVNKSTAVKDMDDVVAPFFNDMRDNETYLQSEVRSKLDKHESELKEFKDELIKARIEAKEQYEWMTDNWKSHKKLLETNQEVAEQTLNTLKAIQSSIPSKELVSDEFKPPNVNSSPIPSIPNTNDISNPLVIPKNYNFNNLNVESVEIMQESSLNPLNSRFNLRTYSKYDVERKEKIKAFIEQFK